MACWAAKAEPNSSDFRLDDDEFQALANSGLDCNNCCYTNNQALSLPYRGCAAVMANRFHRSASPLLEQSERLHIWAQRAQTFTKKIPNGASHRNILVRHQNGRP